MRGRVRRIERRGEKNGRRGKEKREKGKSIGKERVS